MMDRDALRILKRMLMFSIVLLTLLIAVARLAGSRSNSDYYQALRLKHARLDSLDGPKAIVIGGSNGVFGLDSETLEQRLCRPVVNMALHASLGIEFMVNQVAGAIGPGDMVLLTMEPGMFTSESGDLELAMAMDGAMESWRYVPKPKLPKTAATFLVLRAKGAWRACTMTEGNRNGDPVYRADCFDARGDLRLSPDAIASGSRRWSRRKSEHETIKHSVLQQIDRLSRITVRHGAQLHFVWPSVANSADDSQFNQRTIVALAELGIHPVGDPTRYVFPDSAFLDTPWHLKPWGRGERTSRLMEDLCRDSDCCGSSEP
ncbi:MAG: hypothetical protein WAT74_01185 [Flavobacteriales bacterium]